MHFAVLQDLAPYPPLYRNSQTKVLGGGESVFGTNTTSKKPADIWLETNGEATNLYEITVKPINNKRLDDSIDALHSTGHLDKSVTFICRIPEDIRSLEVEDGLVIYKGKEYGLVDYKGFCISLCTLLSDKDFTEIIENMAAKITEIHVSMKAKRGWNEYFSREI